MSDHTIKKTGNVLTLEEAGGISLRLVTKQEWV